MKQIRRALSRYIKHPNRQKALCFDDIKTHWSQLTGEMARHIQPLSLEGDTLTCQVTHPAILQEFTFIEGHLLQRLMDCCPTAGVKNIKCVLGTQKPQTTAVAEPVPDKWSGRKQHYNISAPPTGGAEEPIDSRIVGIDDAQLRLRVHRFFIAVKNRQNSFLKNHWGICETCQSFVEPGRKICLICSQRVH